MGPLPRRGENQLALLSFPPKRARSTQLSSLAQSPSGEPQARGSRLSGSRVPNNPWARAYNLGSAGNLFGISRFDACHFKMTF